MVIATTSERMAVVKPVMNKGILRKMIPAPMINMQEKLTMIEMSQISKVAIRSVSRLSIWTIVGKR